MPSWLQTFVKVNPISQLVTTVRGLMIGGPVGDSLMWTLVWMASCWWCSCRWPARLPQAGLSVDRVQVGSS